VTESEQCPLNILSYDTRAVIVPRPRTGRLQLSVKQTTFPRCYFDGVRRAGRSFRTKFTNNLIAFSRTEILYPKRAKGFGNASPSTFPGCRHRPTMCGRFRVENFLRLLLLLLLLAAAAAIPPLHPIALARKGSVIIKYNATHVRREL